MAKNLFRSLLAVLLAASTIPPAAFAAEGQQEAGEAASSDTLDQFKKATVAIGRPRERTSAVAGRDAMEIVSSGFLYAYTPVEFAPGRSKPDDDGTIYYWAQIWVITCRHCIEILEHPTVRINSKTRGTITHPIPKQFWQFHPTEDVAVAPFRTHYGEYYGKQSLSHVEDSDIRTLSPNNVAMRPQLAKLGFFEYTPVAIVGFPIGMIEGGLRDYPVVRSGRIAQITGYLEGDPGHRTFMVDGSVFPGNSGGPVVIPEGSPSLNGLYRLTGGSVLIGMVSERTFSPLLIGRENADLVGVVTMEAINEVVHQAASAAHRAEEHDRTTGNQ